MSIQKTTLPNGVRILTEKAEHVGSAAIGLWVRTGSSDEFDDEAGISHFIEHMLFKGTPKRSASAIAEEIEGRGGMLNAFTDKQLTCYYCRVLEEDVEVGVDVLCDMLINSLFDPEELEREKGVVIEEIRRAEDEPGDRVHDLHLQRRWSGHALGLPVIGTKESVSGFTRDDLKTYLKRRAKGGHVLLTAAGAVDHDSIVKLAEKHLAEIDAGGDTTELERPTGQPGDNFITQEVEQVHFCIGSDGPSLYDDDTRYATSLLDTIMGGGMSSRLFQEIREKRGLAYSVGSYGLSYTAGGAFTIYGGTGPQHWEQVQELAHVEMKKMREDGPTDDEIFRAKKSVTGMMVLGLEGMSARMMRMARNEIVRGRDVPVEETMQKFSAVTKDQITEQAQVIFDEAKISTTAIGPF